MQVFPAEPFNAEMDRLEDQGRGGWKGSQVKPALLPKDVDKSNTTFRRVMLKQHAQHLADKRLSPSLSQSMPWWQLGRQWVKAVTLAIRQ